MLIVNRYKDVLFELSFEGWTEIWEEEVEGRVLRGEE